MSDGTAAGQSPTSVTVMVPCYNEEDCIEAAYREVSAELSRYDDSEILFVDDGSDDRTLELIRGLAARDERVRYLSFSRNFGLEAAFTAGFKYASKAWTVQLDADLQSPPAEMHKLLAAVSRGYDIAFGVRAGRQDPWHRRVGSIGQQWIADRFLSIQLPRGGSVFRAVRTSVARKIAAYRLSSPYFIATVPLLGVRYVAVPTSHRQRHAGRPKWSLPRLVAHTMDLWIGYSVRPLALAYLAAVAGAAGTAAALVLFGAGIAGPGAVAVTTAAAVICALLGIAGLIRYLMPRLTARQELPRFLVREANLPLDPEDDLYQHERSPAPVGRVPAMRRAR